VVVFTWRNVLLAGAIENVPEDEQAAFEDQIDVAWKPDVFKRAGETEHTALYRFHIEGQTGIEQPTLPPGLRTESSTSSPE
jgi:hypothetical protein